MDNRISSINLYHTISIRNNLPKVPKYYQEQSSHDLPPKDFWVQRLGVPGNYEMQYNITNGSYTSLCVNHPILTAFLYAYNSHEDVVLSPDDVWLMICIYFSKYVNQNSKKLEHLYVSDQTNRLITVENEETIESDWEDFLRQIHIEMTHHVRKDICNLLQNNFSTTTKIESLLSSLTIMSTFRKSFDCTYAINSCGIRNIHFMGTLDDWVLLRDKANQLKLFTIEMDDFFVYIDGILPILDQFISTYQGNVNNQFWDQIFDLKHANDDSNQSDGLYMNGWFLQLCYGYHMKETCFMTYIQLNSLIVPVVVENEHTNTLKTSYLVGGFHGVISQDGKHKPVLSLVVMDDVENVKKLKTPIDD